MIDLRKRLFFLLPAILAALFHNALHESMHYIAARLLNEEVLEFRFLTNGLLTSQVIYATPTAQREGAHWLIIAWSPAVLTTTIGYVLFLTRRRWLTQIPLMNAGLWFATAYFLIGDPLYFGLLAPFFGGGDVKAVEVVGWPLWPVQLLAGIVLLFNLWLVYRLRRESKAQPERYLPCQHRV